MGNPKRVGYGVPKGIDRESKRGLIGSPKGVDWGDMGRHWATLGGPVGARGPRGAVGSSL